MNSGIVRSPSERAGVRPQMKFHILRGDRVVLTFEFWRPGGQGGRNSPAPPAGAAPRAGDKVTTICKPKRPVTQALPPGGFRL
jgi:hypothetical protein